MTTMLDAHGVRTWLAALAGMFEAQCEYLNTLDTKAGDGDHGTTMRRALRATADAVAGVEADTAGLLWAAGSSFRRAAGGAAGPLFGALFVELGRAAGPDGLDAARFATGLQAAAAYVARLGKAERGDRTMLASPSTACRSPTRRTR